MEVEYGSSQPVRFIFRQPNEISGTIYQQKYDAVKNIIENSWVVNLRTHLQTHQVKRRHKLKRLPRNERGRHATNACRRGKRRDHIKALCDMFKANMPVNNGKTCVFRRFNGLEGSGMEVATT